MMMKSENNCKKEHLHIGSRVKKQFLGSGLSIEQFANRISCKSGNIYKIFERERMDTGLLMQISKILNYDFFRLYSEDIQLDESDTIQISFKIDIPRKDWKEENICQYCVLYYHLL
jgi:hypothetical protein